MLIARASAWRLNEAELGFFDVSFDLAKAYHCPTRDELEELNDLRRNAEDVTFF